MSSARSGKPMGAQLRMFPSTWRKTELMDEGVRPQVALRRAASLRYNLAATISSAWGGGGVSLGHWGFDGGGWLCGGGAGDGRSPREMGREGGGGVFAGAGQGARGRHRA